MVVDERAAALEELGLTRKDLVVGVAVALPLVIVVAGCERCRGPLKPDVVFFGEGVPRPRVERAYAMVDAADALLVVGSSLAVFSGFRFVKRAHAAGQPIAIVNLGESRGDPLADVLVEGKAGEVLPRLADALG